MIRQIILALALILIAFSPAARADLIGINFTGGDGPTDPIALGPGDIAGAVPQANWNNLAGNACVAFDLVDSAGASTGVVLRYNPPNTWSSGLGCQPDQRQ